MDSWIWPARVGWPGSTSSLPVEMITTRGRGRTFTRSRPTAASSPICPGPSRVPTVEDQLAGPHVLAARGGCTDPAVGARVMVTAAMPWSVHSTGTTASAPAGMGAPVMIRVESPGCTL